jgi:hypothetical protein
MKNKKLAIITVLLLFFSQFSLNTAKAADECGFGYEYFSLFSLDGMTEIDPEEKCRIATWDYEKKNDGFSKYFSISMDPDDEDQNNTNFSTVQIYCDKKKIEVYVWVEYASSSGWNGSGQVAFDDGAPKKFNYLLQRTFDGVILKDAKTFMRNLVKTEEKFSFKIPTVNGYEVLVYPKGNLLEYRSTFTKAGCKF